MKAGINLVLLAVLASPPAWATGITDVTIDGNQVSAAIELGADIAADLTITFEQAVGLTAENLGLSAELVDPQDVDLLSRLPDPTQAGIPLSFPVRVDIEPPSNSALSFTGIAAIEIYTHNLTYSSGTPLRLVSAPVGGQFRDISEQMGTGSYRVRGSRGDFSEFLIITDLRPLGEVVETKFDRLDELLLTHSASISPAVLTELDESLAAAQSLWASGDSVGAIEQVETFSETVHANSGSDIPDVWSASGDLTNVAGLLRATAATLRFSLNLN